jgi:Integrase core domain
VPQIEDSHPAGFDFLKRLLRAATRPLALPSPTARMMVSAISSSVSFTRSKREPSLFSAADSFSSKSAFLASASLSLCVPKTSSERELVWINVTAHPTDEWVARQVAEAFPWNEAPRYMIRDCDRIYGAVVTRRLRAMGIRDKPIAPASPWQNGFAERLIGSVRRECLDHIIVLGEAHMRRILKSYARYYNETRTQLALDKDAPLSRTVTRAGRILCRPVLGGLHHEYVRI